MKRCPVAGRILALSLATLLLAGCGGGGTSEDDTATDSSGSSSEGDPTASSGETGSADDTGGSDPASGSPGATSEANGSGATLSVDLQILANQLLEPDPNDRIEALDALRGKGPAAKPLAPRIRELGTDDPDADVRTMVVPALVAIEGDSAVAALAAMLEDESEVVRVEVLHAFGELQTDLVTPYLLAAMDSDDAGTRAEAIHIIGEKGLESEEVFGKLEVALEDMDGAVIRAAVQALGKLIAVDKAPAVARAVMDRDAGVRENACRVLGELGVASNEVVYALFRGLDDESLGVREAAFNSLIDLTNPDDTFGYSPTEVDEETRTEAVESWKAAWTSKAGSDG